jgi:charged multivesicular body protein 3
LTSSNLYNQAGVIDGMMEDMLDAQEDEEIEEEADAEVDKVLFDLTNGKLGQAGTVGTELPVRDLLFPFVFF